jgi:hypothetical protein
VSRGETKVHTSWGDAKLPNVDSASCVCICLFAHPTGTSFAQARRLFYYCMGVVRKPKTKGREGTGLPHNTRRVDRNRKKRLFLTWGKHELQIYIHRSFPVK